MNRLKSIFNILLLSCLFAGLSSCHDDTFDFYGVDGDGEAVLSLEACFSPFSEGNLTRASNVAPARGFNTISDLVILVFDEEGKLIPDHIRSYKADELEIADAGRNDSDAGAPEEDRKTAETDTKTVSGINLKLPFGQYFIIGVANFGEYKTTGAGITTIKTSLDRLEEVENFGTENFTLDQLSRLTVGWSNDYANNRAMLGYFADPSSSSPHSGSSYEPFLVNRPGLQPRAWLRRCASKITVDFDGSSLRDNIRIYIKDVKIYDIAKTCTLGFGNPLSNEEDQIGYNNKIEVDDDLTNRPNSDNDEQVIEFGEGDYKDGLWPYVSKQDPVLLLNGEKWDLHTQDSSCLYFYENMQGTKEGYNRQPVPNLESGGVAEGFNEKDDVRYGSYIEVRAHYVSNVTGNSDEYDIKYRFMLGKNVTDNFDAERNYHYKLTLKFLGNANEYHWHIDYDSDFSGFKVPNPWYVSYLYSHDAYLPFEFKLGDGETLEEMKAVIVTNPWYPTNGEETSDAALRDPSKIDLTPITPAGDPNYPYLGNEENRKVWNGFLSLRTPKDESVLSDVDAGTSWPGYKESAININENFYTTNKLGERIIYTAEDGFDADNYLPFPERDKDARLSRQKISGNLRERNYSISIPLFTREKALIKQTGYTGNNPFVGYQRVAQIRLIATVKDKDGNIKTREGLEGSYDQLVNVVQVRRVVNPKGVYRKAGNYDPFHVTLKFQQSEEEETSFRDILSRGPWMAEILGDKNFITLDGKQRVTGSDGDPIDFTIRFNRMGGTGNKNAIVRVKYHNYTCTHLIFVRQGYEPQAICSTGRDFNNPSIEGGSKPTKWSTCNMIAKNLMAEDPRDEGSMFKFGNSKVSIDAYNNAYKYGGNEMYSDLTLSDFQPDGPFFMCNEDGPTFTISDKGIVTGSKSEWTSFSQNNSGFIGDNDFMDSKAATMRDFEQLYLTKYVECGFGVLYADGATTTQDENLEMVNGWHRHDKSGKRDQKGMRGLFVYYWNPTDPDDEYNGKSIFFPIGRSGYGHRKEGKTAQWPFNLEEEANQGKGILRYSCLRYKYANDFGGDYVNFQKVSPLFETLYRRPGAIYWARNKEAIDSYLEWNGKTGKEVDPKGYPAYGLDINYFTLDVNAITEPNVGDANDACFVRTVAE